MLPVAPFVLSFHFSHAPAPRASATLVFKPLFTYSLRLRSPCGTRFGMPADPRAGCAKREIRALASTAFGWAWVPESAFIPSTKTSKTFRWGCIRAGSAPVAAPVALPRCRPSGARRARVKAGGSAQFMSFHARERHFGGVVAPPARAHAPGDPLEFRAAISQMTRHGPRFLATRRATCGADVKPDSCTLAAERVRACRRGRAGGLATGSSNRVRPVRLAESPPFPYNRTPPL